MGAMQHTPQRSTPLHKMHRLQQGASGFSLDQTCHALSGAVRILMMVDRMRKVLMTRKPLHVTVCHQESTW